MPNIFLLRSANLLFGGLAFLAGCSTGPMRVHELQYYRVANSTNANYFRLTIDAVTHIGVSKYRAGYFPARSVDSLFGEVSSTSGVDALRTRDELEKLINTNVFLVTSNWLFAASKPGTELGDLEKLNTARARLLTYPKPQLAPGTVLMDYDPIRGVVERHSDEKMVFLLASDPDSVINKIANFTESDATVLTINRLSHAMSDKQQDSVDRRGAMLQVNKKYDAVAYQALQAALNMAGDSTTPADAAVKEINTLIQIIDSRP